MRIDLFLLTIFFAQHLWGQATGFPELSTIAHLDAPDVTVIKKLYSDRCKYFFVSNRNGSLDTLLFYQPGTTAAGLSVDTTFRISAKQFDKKGRPEIIITWSEFFDSSPADTGMFREYHSVIQIWDLDQQKRLLYDNPVHSTSVRGYSVVDTFDMNGQPVQKELFHTHNCFYEYEIGLLVKRRLEIKHIKTNFSGLCSQPVTKEGGYILRDGKFVPPKRNRKKYRVDYYLPQ